MKIETSLKEVSPVQLKKWLDEGTAVVVDVREPDEHAAERIAGAKLVPMSTFHPENVPTDGARRVVLHCRSGTRARQAANLLINAGQKDVWCLMGGLKGWTDAGLPVERVGRVPISIMRQVQITAGSLVLAGTLLGVFVHPWFLALSAFVGGGLAFAGISGTCGMAALLEKMPWNKAFRACSTSCSG